MQAEAGQCVGRLIMKPSILPQFFGPGYIPRQRLGKHFPRAYA